MDGPARLGGIYLPWRSQRPPALPIVLPQNGRSAPSQRTHPATRRRPRTGKFQFLNHIQACSKIRNFQLAQVQSLVRSQQAAPTTTNHHPTFPDKLVEEALFTSPASPPHSGATVNQLLRRAAMQHRRERRISSDPSDLNEHNKRPRGPDHIIGNNNNNELNLTSHTHPPQTQPADFSPSAMKNNALNLNSTHKNEPVS